MHSEEVNMAQGEAYRTFISTDTTGVGKLFSETDATQVSTEHPMDTETIDTDSTDSQLLSDDFELVTVTEAARLFGIPYTTFYRHVKAGKYKTAPGDDGKVRVAVPRKLNTDTTAESSVSINFNPDFTDNEMEFTEHHTDTSGRFVESSGFLEIFNKQHQDAETARAELREAQKKLESANYRLGYLESQLEQKNEQIKLLTMTQEPTTTWTRFWAWFSGKRVVSDSQHNQNQP